MTFIPTYNPMATLLLTDEERGEATELISRKFEDGDHFIFVLECFVEHRRLANCAVI